MDTPEMKEIIAKEVVPYEWAVWCSVAGGPPFANTVVNVAWSEDGVQLVFMLDSFNFMFVNPDESLTLVPLKLEGYCEKEAPRRRAEHTKLLASRPVPKPKTKDLSLRIVEALDGYGETNPDKEEILALYRENKGKGMDFTAAAIQARVTWLSNLLDKERGK